MTMAEWALLVLLGALSLASALGLLLSRNAVYAALFLVLNFSVGAVIYLLFNAPFLAVTQVAVYAGAIMVLFVFVIMLLGAERLAPAENPPGLAYQRPLAIILAVALLAVAAWALLSGAQIEPSPSVAPRPDSSPQAMGMWLFGPYLLPLQVVALLLLAAMVGALVLSRKS
ncbi:MAG: NADH-quinone oxidoreductase subunit J [Thermoflexales bacterium]